MNRVIVTRAIFGLCGMQVCAIKGATDEEILKVCNMENPAGTTKGWGRVVRTLEKDEPERILPVPCKKYPDRQHFLIYC